MEFQRSAKGMQPAPSTSNLASPNKPLGFKAEVGKGSIEVMAGRGRTVQTGRETSTTPQPSASGLTFSTEMGSPVPNGIPRPHDLVEIGGMKVKVGQAMRDGLIPADLNAAVAPSPFQAPVSEPVSAPVSEPVSEPEHDTYDVSTDFQTHIVPALSPTTMDAIEADMMAGEFTDQTQGYLAFEGNLTPSEMSNVRDAYAAKITAKTGMDEAELQAAHQVDPKGFAKAVSAMLKTGDMTGFDSIAQRAEASAWTALDNDAAMDAWKDPGFPQALIDAGLEPEFKGGEVSVNIPGKGLVKWTDAVAQGYVKVSRS